MSLKTGRIIAIASCIVVCTVFSSSFPTQASGQSDMLVRDGATQPIYSYEDAIREKGYVEAPMDSDHDGELDRIAIQIMRPNTDKKVPVIYEISPYRSRLNDVPNHNVDVELRPAKGKPMGEPDQTQPFSGYYDNYFVPRGYAVILAESAGTGLSGGCPTSGARNETIGAKAVIDWLNGRAKAFDASGKPMVADWTTGNVGMIGVSYNGTLPNAVAATGVKGLKTIVPIAAISSWYDYYRANGAVVAPGGYQGEDADVLAKAVLTRENPAVCQDIISSLERLQDRVTGDMNAFWHERDYVKHASRVKASVFVVHGLNDWNVKTKQFARWWDALAKHKVPRKIWLHQGGHLNPFSFQQQAWLSTLHRWFDYWLYEIPNGIMKEPMVRIERAPGSWEQHATWPDKKAEKVRMPLGAGGKLGKQSHGQPKRLETLIDNPKRTAEQLASNPESPSPNRLAYLGDPLQKDLRISGTPKIRIRASIDRPVANLTALLVDYGTDTRVDYQKGLARTDQRICYGQGIPGDDGCAYLYQHQTHVSSFEIVTRGWLDPQNRISDSKAKPVIPGKEYTFEWDLQADDYVFKKGHRIGIVLVSSDHDFTIRPTGGTKITINPAKSQLILPVVK
jgi:X-Pro dipeptidyl-peptidase